jgi:hypothetical protein
MTRVALITRKSEMVKETPNFRARQFRYYLSRANYQKEWGKGYRRPGFGTRLLAFFLRFMPKIGPFKALDFKIPTRQTEDLYIASVDLTIENYKKLLTQTTAGRLQLTNTDFDTGQNTHAGEYALTDKTYAHLLDQLAGHNFEKITAELRNNLLAFYSDKSAPIETKKKPKDWEKTQEEVEKLRALPEPAPLEPKVASEIGIELEEIPVEAAEPRFRRP